MNVLKHYSRALVRREIYRYSSGRWVALEGRFGGGRVFIRYSGGKPLAFNSPEDVYRLIRENIGAGVRTVYVTAAIWGSLETKEDVSDLNNIVSYTPFWDIDLVSGDWRAVVAAAKAITDYLAEEGVTESVYVLWSGEGAHVRVSEKAFSKEIFDKVHPLVAAYAIVEYVISKVKEKVEDAVKSVGGAVKVENLIDSKRVFTAPLSIHRTLDRVAVCFTPGELDEFDISWASVENFKHSSAWRKYEKGELDDLVKKALKELGHANIKRTVLAVNTDPLEKARRALKFGKRVRAAIGRFQIMGLLQAARYYLLYGDVDKAKSFGLNRAIFYAWAKKRGALVASRKAIGPRVRGTRVLYRDREGRKLVTVAGEEAFIAPSGYFIMGDQEQRPEDFDKEITERINAVISFNQAWRAALNYVNSFPKSILKDPRKFYEKVYKPVRDDFLKILEKGTKISEEPHEDRGKEKQHVEPAKQLTKEKRKPIEQKAGLLKYVKKTTGKNQRK